jgi:hypothetical protein
MAATTGTMIFYGNQSKRSYVVDVYLDDVAGAAINFDQGAGAGATTREEISFIEGVVLADVAIVTGAAQTKLQICKNGVPTGDMLRHTMHLNTLAFRPRLVIPFSAGEKLSALQLA